jgi:hypothetical protein
MISEVTADDFIILQPGCIWIIRIISWGEETLSSPQLIYLMELDYQSRT